MRGAQNELSSAGASGEARPGGVEVDQLNIWVLVDNYYDTNRAEGKNTLRYRVVPGKSIHAEHGLSYYIQTVVDGKTSTCMFDYGLDATGVLNNMDLLGLDVGNVNAFGLSHGHYDHYSSAVEIFRRNQSRIAPGTPFYAGAEAFARRYSLRPNTTEHADLGQLSKEDIEALGLKVVEVSRPTQIIPGAYLTGNIDRVTPYEKVPSTMLVKREGELEQDDFRGEQALFFKVKGRGLVILSGCAHAGIVNTVKQARKLTGMDKVHAVMGGFHLINTKPEVIDSTVGEIKKMSPDHVIPTHCTGFEATVAFSRAFPDAFTLNTVGTRYRFESGEIA